MQRPNRNKSASNKNVHHGESGKNLDAIEIQIQGSSTDLSDAETIRHMATTTTTTTTMTDVRHISFDDSCKKDDGDEVSFQNENEIPNLSNRSSPIFQAKIKFVLF